MKLRIVIAQLNFLVGDVDGNTRRIIAAAVKARDEQSADAILFPELTLTGYPPEDLLRRLELHKRVVKALERLCSEVNGIDIILGFPSLKHDKLYNAAGVIRNGRLQHEYHKRLLPNYDVFDEKRYFSPGRSPCLFDLKGVPVALSICEDIWEHAPARQAARAGARLILNLNASPFHIGKAPEREQLVKRRARTHRLSIIYCNLVGGQDELVFDGGSFVVNGQGVVTQRCPQFTESECLVEIDITDGIEPLPAESAPDIQEEACIYQALVLGTRDYVNKNKFEGAIIGLSGGIDSALTLAIAVDALGPERVEAVMMPSRHTANMSNEDARAMASLLGVKARSISIEPAFKAFLGMLDDTFLGSEVDVAVENIQARCRGTVLMAISNKTGSILLSTGNKSEMSVGYTTLYGDMAGGFAPIKDVPKTLVYRLARYRNSLSPVIPARILERPPSAELKPAQTDEEYLPPYDILDPILKLYVELDQSIERISAAGYDKDLVERIARMVDRNEYKRRQAPPGIRITRRAFGRDRRYPITSGY